MNIKKYSKFFFLFLFISLMTISAVSATCTVILDEETHNQGDYATAEMSCSSSAEKSQAYTLTWSNGTILQINTGTTPSSTSTSFYEQFLIPTDYVGSDIVVSLAGTNLEGSDSFNVSSASVNDLIISDFTFSDDLFLGMIGAVSFEVTDSSGYVVNNAKCNVEFLDSSGKPVSVLEAPRTIAGSTVVSSTIETAVYKEGLQYAAHIHCSCGLAGTGDVCWNDNLDEITKANGDSVGTFQIDRWLSVNTVVNKNTFVGREEIFICANVTSIDPVNRVPMNIYHQIRCSNGEDIDSDTDRALLTGDDSMPDERGISPNSTQMQCKRFIIPEPPYLQGGSNGCYASTNVVVLNTEREEIVTYASTSNVFNITVSDLNIFPDWELVEDDVFNSIINLSDEKYSVYQGNGTSNIDLQLSRSYTESIKSADQYYKYPLSIDSFFDASLIKNASVLDVLGNQKDYSIEVLDDGNVELEIKDVDISSSGWYNVTLELINYDERQTVALERSSGASPISDVVVGDFITNLDIVQNNILESELVKLNLSVLSNPLQGSSHSLVYNFYSRQGVGELVLSQEVQVIGTGDHNIYFRTDKLTPEDLTETYLVTVQLESFNEYGVVSLTDEETVGFLTVSSLDGYSRSGKVGFYDVVVDVKNSRYELDSTIEAKVLIKNTGDLPDEDTVLTYYLEDSTGKKFSESKEQILEVPPGETYFTKEITLPTIATIGDWKFVVEYATVVQPLITAYDSFEVVDELPFSDKYAVTKFLKSNYDDYPLLSTICFCLMILIILAFLLSKKEKK